MFALNTFLNSSYEIVPDSSLQPPRARGAGQIGRKQGSHVIAEDGEGGQAYTSKYWNAIQ